MQAAGAHQVPAKHALALVVAARAPAEHAAAAKFSRPYKYIMRGSRMQAAGAHQVPAEHELALVVAARIPAEHAAAAELAQRLERLRADLRCCLVRGCDLPAAPGSLKLTQGC